MRTFTDNTGRAWTIAINVDAIKRVKSVAKVDLLEAVEGKLLERLVGDPILLCDVVYALCKPQADAGFTAIKNAFLASGLIALKILDKAGGQGPDGDFAITSFSRNEALEETITVSVTAKLAVFRSWIEGA